MRTILLLTMTLALTFSAAAEDCCTGWCFGTDVALPPTPAGEYWLSLDPPCPGACIPTFWTPWIYEETNGIEGLQRADELRDDTCGGRIAPDTLIF